MKFFENLFMRAKLLLSLGLIWVMFLVVIIAAYVSIKNITKSEKELHHIQFTIDNELSDLRAYLNYNRLALLEMMLTNNPSEQSDIEESINEKTQENNTIIERLKKLKSNPEFLSRITELKNYMSAYQETREKVFSLIKEGKDDEVKKLVTGIQSERFEKIRLILVNLDNEAKQESDNRLRIDLKNANVLILLFVIIGVVALIFSVTIIVLMNRTIARPLNQISKTAAGIASGDLNIEIKTYGRKDEVGLLNKAFFQMAERLRGSIKDIVDAINLLSSSASEIMAATAQVAAGATESATAINETTTTVEEVLQAAQLSSQKASHVSENSQKVVQVTQAGRLAVEETVNGMHDIQIQMESIANTIIRLSEQSQQIGSIISSVNDIADQSNLLAVNAAIEAAKAGEQGKGFSVVAQEIKSLALQSKQATIQVHNILGDIQKATTAAVLATEKGSKAVENGVKQTAQAGESIRLLSQSVDESAQAATQILASSQQQVIGMDQVGIAMTNINQAGAENAESMKQIEKTAKDLHELGQKLKHLVEQYKI